ncbi:hypothetical protein GCM10009634_30450 [Saccharothrix xinjiangensis]
MTTVAPTTTAAVAVATATRPPTASAAHTAPGSTQALANTGPSALWLSVLGLGGVLSGALLVLFSRRRA